MCTSSNYIMTKVFQPRRSAFSQSERAVSQVDTFRRLGCQAVVGAGGPRAENGSRIKPFLKEARL